MLTSIPILKSKPLVAMVPHNARNYIDPLFQNNSIQEINKKKKQYSQGEKIMTKSKISYSFLNVCEVFLVFLIISLSSYKIFVRYCNFYL